MSHSSTATSLVMGLRSGEPSAWDRMVDLYGPVVYRWLRKAGVSAGDSGDVAQEVLVAVLGRIGSFRRARQQDTFRGWLWTITRNKVADYWKRRAREPQAAGGSDAQVQLHELPNREDSADTDFQPNDVGTLYRRAAEAIQTEFEPKSWQAFVQVVIDGRRCADVAADLGMTLNAVYIAKSRILQRVRVELGDLEP